MRRLPRGMGNRPDAIVSRAQLRALKTRRGSGRQEIKCHWPGGGYVMWGITWWNMERGPSHAVPRAAAVVRVWRRDLSHGSTSSFVT